MSAYHLNELKIASDPNNPNRALPPPVSPSSRVLDIGCGAGQTLIAAYPAQISFGLDVDVKALRLGKSLTDRVRFVVGRAEALPFASEQFDLVFARVSLPYTNIPASLGEIRRVLKRGGTVWLTFHPFSLTWKQALDSNYRGKIFFLYILLNSFWLHFFQRQFGFLGKHESFQTEQGVRRTLEQKGFENISVTHEEHFLVTARAK